MSKVFETKIQVTYNKHIVINDESISEDIDAAFIKAQDLAKQSEEDIKTIKIDNDGKQGQHEVSNKFVKAEVIFVKRKFEAE